MDCLRCSSIKSITSSVPCEQLFSGTKHIATDCQASLELVVFEELTIMKSAWGPKIYDKAGWNSFQVETCLIDFEQLLIENDYMLQWEQDLGKDSNLNGLVV